MPGVADLSDLDDTPDEDSDDGVFKNKAEGLIGKNYPGLQELKKYDPRISSTNGLLSLLVST